MITIVSPVYNGEKTIAQLLQRLDAVAQTMGETFQIILVDDASTDRSWAILQNEAAKRGNLQVQGNSTNLGQHPSIFRGLVAAKGDFIVVMDGDLQDQPEEIPALYRAMQNGVAVVLARRVSRHDGRPKKWASQVFYYVLHGVFGIKMQPEVANFGLYRKSVIDAVLQSDYQAFFPLAIQKVKPQIAYVDVEHAPAQTSSYTLTKRLRLAWSILRHEARHR